MVKIIEEKRWKWDFSCTKCSSVLEADENDLEWAMFGAANYAGDSGEKKYYINCPVCGEDNFPKPDTLTDKIKKNARKYNYQNIGEYR